MLCGMIDGHLSYCEKVSKTYFSEELSGWAAHKTSAHKTTGVAATPFDIENENH